MSRTVQLTRLYNVSVKWQGWNLSLKIFQSTQCIMAGTVIPAYWSLKLEDGHLKASLSYRANSRTRKEKKFIPFKTTAQQVVGRYGKLI